MAHGLVGAAHMNEKEGKVVGWTDGDPRRVRVLFDGDTYEYEAKSLKPENLLILDDTPPSPKAASRSPSPSDHSDDDDKHELEKQFPLQSRVMAHSLAGAAHLNGEEGTVIAHRLEQDPPRVLIDFDEFPNDPKALKSDNLIRADEDGEQSEGSVKSEEEQEQPPPEESEISSVDSEKLQQEKADLQLQLESLRESMPHFSPSGSESPATPPSPVQNPFTPKTDAYAPGVSSSFAQYCTTPAEDIRSAWQKLAALEADQIFSPEAARRIINSPSPIGDDQSSASHGANIDERMGSLTTMPTITTMPTFDTISTDPPTEPTPETAHLWKELEKLEQEKHFLEKQAAARVIQRQYRKTKKPRPESPSVIRERDRQRMEELAAPVRAAFNEILCDLDDISFLVDKIGKNNKAEEKEMYVKFIQRFYRNHLKIRNAYAAMIQRFWRTREYRARIREQMKRRRELLRLERQQRLAEQQAAADRAAEAERHRMQEELRERASVSIQRSYRHKTFNQARTEAALSIQNAWRNRTPRAPTPKAKSSWSWNPVRWLFGSKEPIQEPPQKRSTTTKVVTGVAVAGVAAAGVGAALHLHREASQSASPSEASQSVASTPVVTTPFQPEGLPQIDVVEEIESHLHREASQSASPSEASQSVASTPVVTTPFQPESIQIDAVEEFQSDKQQFEQIETKALASDSVSPIATSSHAGLEKQNVDSPVLQTLSKLASIGQDLLLDEMSLPSNSNSPVDQAVKPPPLEKEDHSDNEDAQQKLSLLIPANVSNEDVAEGDAVGSEAKDEDHSEDESGEAFDTEKHNKEFTEGSNVVDDDDIEISSSIADEQAEGDDLKTTIVLQDEGDGQASEQEGDAVSSDSPDEAPLEDEGDASETDTHNKELAEGSNVADDDDIEIPSSGSQQQLQLDEDVVVDDLKTAINEDVAEGDAVGSEAQDETPLEDEDEEASETGKNKDDIAEGSDAEADESDDDDDDDDSDEGIQIPSSGSEAQVQLDEDVLENDAEDSSHLDDEVDEDEESDAEHEDQDAEDLPSVDEEDGEGDLQNDGASSSFEHAGENPSEDEDGPRKRSILFFAFLDIFSVFLFEFNSFANFFDFVLPGLLAPAGSDLDSAASGSNQVSVSGEAFDAIGLEDEGDASEFAENSDVDDDDVEIPKSEPTEQVQDVDEGDHSVASALEDEGNDAASIDQVSEEGDAEDLPSDDEEKIDFAQEASIENDVQEASDLSSELEEVDKRLLETSEEEGESDDEDGLLAPAGSDLESSASDEEPRSSVRGRVTLNMSIDDIDDMNEFTEDFRQSVAAQMGLSPDDILEVNVRESNESLDESEPSSGTDGEDSEGFEATEFEDSILTPGILSHRIDHATSIIEKEEQIPLPSPSVAAVSDSQSIDRLFNTTIDSDRFSMPRASIPNQTESNVQNAVEQIVDQQEESQDLSLETEHHQSDSLALSDPPSRYLSPDEDDEENALEHSAAFESADEEAEEGEYEGDEEEEEEHELEKQSKKGILSLG